MTGLTITPRQEVVVPRKTKRYIRSLLRKYIAGAMKPEEKRSLAGYLAFLNDCEPRYINNLVLKYGADIVREAFTMEYWKSTTGRSVS